jgi:hypothetical protein
MPFPAASLGILFCRGQRRKLREGRQSIIGQRASQRSSWFPEGLYDRNLQNIWVYVENPYDLDLCFVLNEDYEGDLGEYFEHSRLAGF